MLKRNSDYKLKTENEFTKLQNTIQNSAINRVKQVKEQVNDYPDKEISLVVTRINNTERKLDALLEKKHFDPDVTIIVKDIAQNHGEIIFDKARDFLISGLGISDVRIVRTKRLKARGRRPGLMKIEVPSLEHKLKLLRNSWKLKDNVHYRNVFIRSSKSHPERKVELNSWMIVEENGWQNWFKMASNGRLKRNRDHNYRQPQKMRPQMNGPGYFNGPPGPFGGPPPSHYGGPPPCPFGGPPLGPFMGPPSR